MKTKWAAKILSGILILTVLSACSGTGNAPSNVDSTSSTKTTAVNEKTVYLTSDSALSTMDSCAQIDAAAMNAIAYTNDSLYNYDTGGKAVLGLAKSVQISKDHLTYTFKIRDDAVWSNGDPVTAHDFEFAWKRLGNSKTASEYGYMLHIAGIKNADKVLKGANVDELGVKATDDKTLVVKLDTVVPYFTSLLTGPYFTPINKKFFQKQGDKYGLTPETTLSCGPFYLSEWEVGGKHYVLKKNNKYYNASRIKLNTIDYKLVSDPQQAVMSYESGDLDYVGNLTGDTIEKYKSNSELKKNLIGMLWFLSPNTKVAGLNNADLRRAIALAIDKKSIAEDILKDGSIAANFAVPKNFAIGYDGKYFRDTTIDYMKQNIQQAQQYFAKAKQELGQNKFNFELLYESDTPSCAQIGQFLQSQLQSALPGLTVKLKVTTKKNRLQLMNNGQYQLALTRWGGDYQDPTTFLTMWQTGNSYDYGKYSNPQYNSLLESCVSGNLAEKPKERWEALQKAESIVLNDAGIIPLYQVSNASLVKPNISNLYYIDEGGYLWKYADKK